MIETLYAEYLNGNEKLQNAHNAELKKLSSMVDNKLEAGELTTGDLADYEEAASRAGFYAGFKAAMSIMAELEM
mgnify:FL=1